MRRDVRATFVDPALDVEATVTACVLRRYQFTDPFVTAPASVVPDWAAVGCDVVVGDDGSVVTAYTVRDVAVVDLAAQRVDGLPDEWHGRAVESYHRR